MILKKSIQDEDQVSENEEYEENSNYSFTFKKAIFVVIGLHILIVGGIAFSSHTLKAREDISKTDKEYLNSKDSVYVGVEPSPTPSPSPSPSPIPPIKTLESAPVPNKNYPQKKYTEFYVVKKGDTIYSISKKYKLNPERLIKLNNIKNPNEIKIGQTLKFL
jgi:LysM repeat protein